ncbi:MAG: hypothetical protein EXR73_02610 [Myxococcales bacterium]|nr:hypothetical protein [Myxococcales bacterium]
MRITAAIAISLPIALLGACSSDGGDTPPGLCAATLAPGADDQTTLQAAFIGATTGDRLCLRAGTFRFTDELSLTVHGITLVGVEDTVLDFAGQVAGGNGMNITGDDFTAENFTLKNAPGDGIRVSGASNVTFRGLDVSWDAGSVTANGAYAIYPVTCEGVLVEDCDVAGASDAGIYVGQSTNIIVRNNKVHGNVAGIEIENSTNAEVHDNEAYDNTSGILVFNLPDLPVGDGHTTLVHHNIIRDNNRENFAGGGVVAAVPHGTGVIILANDNVEFRNNTVTGNISTGFAVASYKVLEPNPDDPDFDAYPETVYVHDNMFSDNGSDPQGLFLLSRTAPLEDMIWDGYFDANKVDTDGSLKICIKNNGAATFRNVDWPNNFATQSTDVAPHACEHPAIPPVTLAF